QPLPCGRTGRDGPLGVLVAQWGFAPLQIPAGDRCDTGDTRVTVGGAVRSAAQTLGSARACLCSCLSEGLLSAVVESAALRPGADGGLRVGLVGVAVVRSRQAGAGRGCDRSTRATDGGTWRGECLGFEGALCLAGFAVDHARAVLRERL